MFASFLLFTIRLLHQFGPFAGYFCSAAVRSPTEQTWISFQAELCRGKSGKQQQQQGTLAPHQQLQSRLSGLLSPAERYTKTLSNGDLRNHHHIGSTLAGKFDFGRQTQPPHGPNRRACSTLDISDHHRVTQRQLRHSGVMTSSSARPRNAFNFENVRSPLNLSTNDVVYWRHGVTLIMWR